MKRAAVTGGTGFIGANLARRLLHDGHEVHLLVQREYSSWRLEGIGDSLQLHEVDLADARMLEPVLRSIRPDWIFHLAAHGAYSSQTDWRRMIQTNVLGSANLLDASLAATFEAFVNTGTSSEYGFKDHAPSEEEALEPNSHYAVTKAAATLHCRHVARSRQANVTTLRLYSAYGPYEEPTRLMPSLVLRGLQGELPPLVDPEIAHDYIHVDDACEAYVLAAAARSAEPGGVYNIGTGIQTTMRDVVETARRLLNIEAEPAWGTLPNRQWDTSIWMADNRKAVARLGWSPRHTFTDGFSSLVNWFHDNPGMQAFYRERQDA